MQSKIVFSDTNQTDGTRVFSLVAPAKAGVQSLPLA